MLVARPQAEDPLVVVVHFRISAENADVLESVAHLERTSTASYARRVLEERLAVMSTDEHVMIDRLNRADYATEDAAITPIRRSRTDPEP
jgi:hypothetical protein